MTNFQKLPCKVKILPGNFQKLQTFKNSFVKLRFYLFLRESFKVDAANFLCFYLINKKREWKNCLFKTHWALDIASEWTSKTVVGFCWVRYPLASGQDSILQQLNGTKKRV